MLPPAQWLEVCVHEAPAAWQGSQDTFSCGGLLWSTLFEKTAGWQELIGSLQGIVEWPQETGGRVQELWGQALGGSSPDYFDSVERWVLKS